MIEFLKGLVGALPTKAFVAVVGMAAEVYLYKDSVGVESTNLLVAQILIAAIVIAIFFVRFQKKGSTNGG